MVTATDGSAATAQALSALSDRDLFARMRANHDPRPARS